MVGYRVAWSADGHRFRSLTAEYATLPFALNRLDKLLGEDRRLGRVEKDGWFFIAGDFGELGYGHVVGYGRHRGQPLPSGRPLASKARS